MKGYVARMVVDKGYGFIRGEDGQDHFFHKSSFNGFWDDLQEDYTNGIKVKVTFEVLKTPKGPRADQVNRTDDGSPLTHRN